MHNITARIYSSEAEMYEAYRARQNRLRKPETRKDGQPAAMATILQIAAPEPVPVAEEDPPADDLTPEAYFKHRCHQLAIGVREMQSDTRRPDITGPRQELMFEMCLAFPELSFPAVGRIFHKDNSTVIHAVTKVCKDRGIDIADVRAAKQKSVLERTERVREMYFANARYADICREVGICKITITRMARQHGWKIEALKIAARVK